MEWLKIELGLKNLSPLERSPESEIKVNSVDLEQDTKLEMFIIDQRIKGLCVSPQK